MFRNIKIFYLVTILTFIFALTQAMAVDEAKLTKSADKLLERWVTVLSKGVIEYIRGPDDFWRASKSVLINGSQDFKIEKTDLVAPAYNLFIKFSLRYLGANSFSPHASPSPRGDMDSGFPTIEDSRRHVNDSDFGGFSAVFEYNLRYAFLNDKWVLRDTDKIGSPLDYTTLTGKEMFQNLLSVPIEDLQ